MAWRTWWWSIDWVTDCTTVYVVDGSSSRSWVSSGVGCYHLTPSAFSPGVGGLTKADSLAFSGVLPSDAKQLTIEIHKMGVISEGRFEFMKNRQNTPQLAGGRNGERGLGGCRPQYNPSAG